MGSEKLQVEEAWGIQGRQDGDRNFPWGQAGAMGKSERPGGGAVQTRDCSQTDQLFPHHTSPEGCAHTPSPRPLPHHPRLRPPGHRPPRPPPPPLCFPPGPSLTPLLPLNHLFLPFLPSCSTYSFFLSLIISFVYLFIEREWKGGLAHPRVHSPNACIRNSRARSGGSTLGGPTWVAGTDLRRASPAASQRRKQK